MTRDDISDNKLNWMNESHQQAIDRDSALTAAAIAPDHPSFPEILRSELKLVLTSPDFMRAPTMNRLLAYLVTETAEGRADQLKAYAVAVDGLGRAPDYDARADSYPRVQVGRLRRMLDTHYAHAPTSAGYRLAIPSGRYRVTLTSDTPSPPVPDAPQPSSAAVSLRVTRLAMAQMLGLLALMVVVAGLIAYRAPTFTAIANDGRQRPLLEFSAVTHGPAKSLRDEIVGATLINGLGRSDMFDLRIAQRAGSRPAEAPAPYRLSTDLLDGPKPRLFLRLWHQQPDRLLWSGDVALPPASAPEQSIEDVLAPVISTIGRVNGLIAQHEFQRTSADRPSGHRCILLYYRYRKERLASERGPVRDCVDRSLKSDAGDAVMQAVAAQLSLDLMASSRTPAGERAGLFAAARRHSQLATSIDPLNAWGIVARSRIAMLRQSCPLAVRNAVKASQLQPYDPTLLSDAGVTLLNCGDSRAEGLIRSAIALDDGADGQFYRPLLLIAISRDDRALAQEALSAMAPPVIGRQASFYILAAAGYAMMGEDAPARAAWRQLQANNPAIASDPGAYFERLGVGTPVRDKAIGHLREARLIA